jgi:nucleotide-binding universal stress UspA family protein
MSWTIKKPILVPYDFSEHSHKAVDKALELAGNSTLVHVLHVLPYPLLPKSFPAEEIDDQVRIDYAAKLLAGEFQDAHYKGVLREVLVGDPGTVCSDRAEAMKADLIVLPSHGRSGVSRLLLGSVTERIVRLAKCPVLVLKV